jgi:hypothetical protein
MGKGWIQAIPGPESKKDEGIPPRARRATRRIYGEPSGCSFSWLSPEGWVLSGKFDFRLKEIRHLYFRADGNNVNGKFWAKRR